MSTNEVSVPEIIALSLAVLVLTKVQILLLLDFGVGRPENRRSGGRGQDWS